MTDIQYLSDRVYDYEESVRFLGNQGKSERELFIVRSFLRNFREPFGVTDLEVVSRREEPPDVRVRKFGIGFECKEVPDDGRRRHAQYKAKLARAKIMLEDAKAGRDVDLAALCEEWQAEPISIAEAARYAMRKAHAEAIKVDAYAPAVRAKLDLLVYVCFLDRVAVPDKKYFDGAAAAPDGWRSVSFFANQCAGVLFAAPDSPDFLSRNVGRLVYRDPVMSGEG
jgi:Putative endonuclease, protein of unknown function (DUF1780)